jgi:ribosomal protein L37AE/L43A
MKTKSDAHARYSRPCPQCGSIIHTGDVIKPLRKIWICPDCYAALGVGVPVYLRKEIKRMDQEFSYITE